MSFKLFKAVQLARHLARVARVGAGHDAALRGEELLKGPQRETPPQDISYVLKTKITLNCSD